MYIGPLLKSFRITPGGHRQPGTIAGRVGRVAQLQIRQLDIRAVAQPKRGGRSVRIATDTGSYGHHGFVTELLQPQDYDVVYICGPEPMMRAKISASPARATIRICSVAFPPRRYSCLFVALKLLRSGPMYKDDFCYFMGVSLIIFVF